MKDNKAVVAMPEHLQRARVNVAEFARSQDRKEPPKLRRSLTRTNTETSNSLRTSKSPGRRRMNGSRDLVQEVYDRMGVNYVRGQSSSGIYDSNGSYSANSEISKLTSSVSSNVSRANGVPTRSFQNLSLETRNDDKDDNNDDFQGPKSCRSARSVKSLMSAFGGGKSVVSAKSVATKDSFQAPGFVDTGDIDCRDDGDMDGTMSVISLESNWTRGRQKMAEEDSRHGELKSFRSSKAVVSAPTKLLDSVQAEPKSSLGFSSGDEAIDRLIEEKLQEKIAELTANFEAKFRALEEETNRRLEKLEKESSRGKNTTAYPYSNFRL